MSRSGFEKKELGYGNHSSVGEQGSRKGGSKGGNVPHVNNPDGISPKSNGSKKRNLGVEGPREDTVGK